MNENTPTHQTSFNIARAPLPPLLKVNEVASLLRISRPKVYILISEGIVEGFKVGSDWRVKSASLLRLLS